MSERDTFERILASLHEAALDDTRWPTASALIDDALGVHGNSLAIIDVRSSEDIQVNYLGLFLHGQQNRELEREYFEVYYPLDERVPRLRELPHSRLNHMSEFYTAEELKSSLLYNEYLPRVHGQNCINVRLDGPDDLNICWIVHDPVDGEDWTSARLDFIRRLLPHIRQYMSVRQALANAGALSASLTELLDTTGLSIIQLDPRGRIVEVNDRARDLLRTGDDLFDRSGFLFARRPEDNAHLQELLKRALPSFRTQGVGGSTVVRRESALPLLMHINPVERQSTDSHVWPVAALVLVVDPASRTLIVPAMAGEVFGFSEAESRVAVLMADGMSVREIAAATGRKESTIRWHVKRMFAKHGLSREAELVRLVLSLSNSSEYRDRMRKQP